ncbi:DUF4157 domain-containing protein, partial [Nostoc sp. FACHB-973]|nr:DUF4157 domain-containing protein [Nostoc sp. FACHB-973]
LSGQCSECQSKKLTLQRQQKNQEDVSEVPPIVHEVLRSPGKPLDSDIRAFMESRFGYDFSQVRVYTDAKAAESAQAVNALAYTVGRNIVFGAGEYVPQTEEGLELLTHELTHTIQQGKQTDLSTSLKLASSNIEEEVAEQMAEAVISQSSASALKVKSHLKDSSKPPKIAPTSLYVARRTTSKAHTTIYEQILNGMINIVKKYPEDQEDRLEALTQLFATVSSDQAKNLYNRLEPGSPKDDFAQYFKNQFPKSRTQGLAFLRQKFLSMPQSYETSKKSKPSQFISSETIGQQISDASCKLPVTTDNIIRVSFGQSMNDNGYIYNPRYWIVEYHLIKDSNEKIFVSSKEEPSAWQEVLEFLKNDEKTEKKWQRSILNITVKIGQYGASAAINDVWQFPDKYSIDCLGAATLIQLRGIYFSYPESYRDAAFDRDYNSFVIERYADRSKLPKISLESDLDIVKINPSISLFEWQNNTQLKVKLQPGDQIPIENRYMPTNSAWRTENVVYIGDNKFFGHPIGSVTTKEYATKISKFIDANYVDPEIGKQPPKELEELIKFILKNSYIGSYSRPRSRSVNFPSFEATAP